MARSKKRKKFRDFESSAIIEDFKEQYISLTRSMLINEKWLNLKYSSQVIYIQMKLWARGKQEFKYSYSLAENILGSTRTIKSSIEELIDNGFIEIVKCSKRPGIGTIYKFSNNWYMCNKNK